jgi:3-hydroxyacyl-CoA dehydrogenase / enoyl-CoA hydratase / 3-hydroxybutyryl-CoA epimerase / enoyl-CoA isomerase
MLYNGNAFRLELKSDQILNVIFDLKDQSANVFNAQALGELAEVLAIIKKQSNIQGLIFSSAKEGFVFGADITEFLGHFKKI